MSTPKGYELLPVRFPAEDLRLVAGDHVKVGFKTGPPPKGGRRGWPEGERRADHAALRHGMHRGGFPSAAGRGNGAL